MDRWVIRLKSKNDTVESKEVPRSEQNDKSVNREEVINAAANVASEYVDLDPTDDEDDHDDDDEHYHDDLAFVAQLLYNHMSCDNSTSIDVRTIFDSTEAIFEGLKDLEFRISPNLVRMMRASSPPTPLEWLALEQDQRIDPCHAYIVYIVVMTKSGFKTPLVYTGSSINRDGGHLRLRDYRNLERECLPSHVRQAGRDGYIISNQVVIAGTALNTCNSDAAYQVCLILMLEAMITFKMWTIKSATWGTLQNTTLWKLSTFQHRGLRSHSPMSEMGLRVGGAMDDLSGVDIVDRYLDRKERRREKEVALRIAHKDDAVVQARIKGYYLAAKDTDEYKAKQAAVIEKRKTDKEYKAKQRALKEKNKAEKTPEMKRRNGQQQRPSTTIVHQRR